MNKLSPEPTKQTCAHCIHFQNDATQLERAFPGLNVMSSGFASVRAQDGLCSRHNIYLAAWDSCAEFKPREG